MKIINVYIHMFSYKKQRKKESFTAIMNTDQIYIGAHLRKFFMKKKLIPSDVSCFEIIMDFSLYIHYT